MAPKHMAGTMTAIEYEWKSKIQFLSRRTPCLMMRIHLMITLNSFLEDEDSLYEFDE